MKTLRIGLHSIVLALGCLISILVGFGIYYLLRVNWPVDQLIVQVPVAVVALLLGFASWYQLISRPTLCHLRMASWGEVIAVYLLSLAITPLIFLPLHYLTQGYLTSIDNVLALLYFQIPTHFIAILTAVSLLRQPELAST
jgi:hypothetical protein